MLGKNFITDASKQQNSDTEPDLGAPKGERGLGFRVQYDLDYFF